MDILSKLFGGSGIVKILRLFLFNSDEAYEPKDVAKRTRTDSDVVRGEISMLSKINLIKKKTFYKEVEEKTTRRRKTHSKKVAKKKITRKRVSGWILNPEFLYLEELKGLLIGTAGLEEKDILRRLRKAGSIKLVIVSGVFMQDWDSRLDIMVVGDNLKNQQLSTAIKEIEAEMGREIRFAVFSTKDFKYRLGMYDRLIRDVLDYPHQTIVDRIGIS